MKNQHATFWIDKKDQQALYGQSLSGGGSVVKALKLRSYQRAVSNFVKILTKQEIPVRFYGGDSYTDGKSITISANVNTKNFDVTVGLALHEASHIACKSDFELMKYIGDYARSLGLSSYLGKGILNWIEDRRIDAYTKKNAPGYVAYYDALMEYYFVDDKLASKWLKSLDSREETPGNYMKHVMCSFHPDFNVNALPMLPAIMDLINQSPYLKDAAESYETAKKVLDLIKKSQQEQETQEQETEVQETGEQEAQEQETQEQETEEETGEETEEQEAEEETEEQETEEETEEQETEEEAEEELESLTQEELDTIDQAFNSSPSSNGEFDNISETQKKAISSSVKKLLPNLDDVDMQGINYNGKNINVLIYDFTSGSGLYNKLVEFNQLMEKETKYLSGSDINRRSDLRAALPDEVRPLKSTMERNHIFVQKGLQMGKALGKRLKLVSETRSLVYNRMKSGSLDKRRVAQLGYDVESVFQQTLTDKYKKANIEISIDASASMGQESKYQHAIQTAMAIATAASLTRGQVQCQVNLRSSTYQGTPILINLYDSRVNQLSQLVYLLTSSIQRGYTPEGLVFEAKMDKGMIVNPTRELDSYFFNISDGMPFIPRIYGANGAYTHTRKAVEKMRAKGIQILSFFEGEPSGGELSAFKKMYGKDAKSVSPESLSELAKAINDKLLSTKETV